MICVVLGVLLLPLCYFSFHLLHGLSVCGADGRHDTINFCTRNFVARMTAHGHSVV